MDSQVLSQKGSKLMPYLSWLLVALSIYSCSSRADYNIIIGFLILLLRSQFASDKFKSFTKATIHIILLSVIIDLIWLFEYYGYWKHGEDTSDLWKSLSLIHNTTYYLGIVEFLIKIPLILFLYKQFIGLGGQIGELIRLNYSQK